MGEQSHRSDPRVLNRRTLERDHRRLAALLRPGMAVLDVGCGTGAITAGIARAVGPEGRVVGLDRDVSLLPTPVESNLTFQQGEVHALPFEGCFDVVSAARVLQWVNHPVEALRQMRKALRPGGWVVVLDYNHAANAWEPEPPASFRMFWDAFLSWRESHGWDNRMADHLPGLFAEVGIRDVEVHVDDEIAVRGAEGFEEAATIWAKVIETIGPGIGAGGVEETLASYREWIATSLQRQTLCMRTVIGR